MLREIEAANLRARHVTFRCVRGALVAEISLPVSKSDQEARGVARAHACLCADGPVRRDCPAHAAFLHLRLLRPLFPARFAAGVPDRDMPFFPQAAGTPASKAGFANTIRRAAQLQDIQLTSEDGLERISGHSLRATGAQGMATLGLDTYAVQLLGRWGSGVVLKYVRAAAITAAASSARAAALATTLRTITGAATAEGLRGAHCTEELVA